MAKKYSFPGVYVNEIKTPVPSIAQVETAIPAFIGYTQIAEKDGASVVNQPIKINSFAEFVLVFGEGLQAGIEIIDAPADDVVAHVLIGGVGKAAVFLDDAQAMLFPSIKLFYENGGRSCYVVSVGLYGMAPTVLIEVEALLGTQLVNGIPTDGGLKALESFDPPTLLVVPDAVLLPPTDGYRLYQAMLAQCASTKKRFAILDIPQGYRDRNGGVDVITEFRTGIGSNDLSFGAVYYPWLHTAMIPRSEINLSQYPIDLNLLKDVLPELLAKQQIQSFLDNAASEDDLSILQAKLSGSSPSFKGFMDQIHQRLNLLPPSAALAGIYSHVDTSRGVWKAPANVGVRGVNEPSVSISQHDQEDLNVDTVAGKSVNAIRNFSGRGILVWGARTLAGNDNEWRYVNVRRYEIALYQSVKTATLFAVFEPNDANLWASIRAVVTNFLTQQWRHGGLVGTKPSEAFSVRVGLGETMSVTDIQNGRLIIDMMVAMIHPAEFIVIRVVHHMATSP